MRGLIFVDLGSSSLRCMELYLDCVTNRDNISLLYGIAQKLKAVRDAMIPDLEGNEVRLPLTPYPRSRIKFQLLYQLSDLGQIILRNKAAQHQWAITSYPGTVRLPRDIFHNLSTPEERNRVCLPPAGRDVTYWSECPAPISAGGRHRMGQ